MTYRTLAASILALGLVSPISAFAADNGFCSQEQSNRSDYIDCNPEFRASTEQTALFGAAVAAEDVRKVGPVGDYIDETPSESNARSSN